MLNVAHANLRSGIPFTLISSHPKYGGRITVEGDVSEYFFQPGQKFVPHVLKDTTHPASAGDMVTLTKWLANQLGVAVAYVTGVRTMKSSVKDNGTRQVELLGLPCKWYSINHFEEYQGLQITDHIWGNAFNRPEGEKPITVFNTKSGDFLTGYRVMPNIFPNH